VCVFEGDKVFSDKTVQHLQAMKKESMEYFLFIINTDNETLEKRRSTRAREHKLTSKPDTTWVDGRLTKYSRMASEYSEILVMSQHDTLASISAVLQRFDATLLKRSLV